jgi:hypothetical protein
MFFKTVSIPMGTNCAPFLADLFHYSYEADFIQGFFKKTEKKASLILQFHIQLYGWCILNNSKFDDFVDDINPIELEIKDTTNTARSASYFDLCIKIDSDVRLRTKRCGKRDDFHFPIMNFPFICSNNSSSTCICMDRQTDNTMAKLKRDKKTNNTLQKQSLSWSDIPELVIPIRIYLIRVLLLTRKLLKQGFLLVKLKSSLRKFYGSEHD